LRHVSGLRDDLSLALAHGAADMVVLVPSRLGNLPQGVSGAQAQAHGQLYRQLLTP
jgi:hypothetical protein